MRHFLAAVTLALLATDARAADPTCALLDPEKTPRAALLEAKLLAEPGASWVERADIDKVLREQKLQAAFGPQGVGERVRLGKLLKADVLVMVRPVKDAREPALEVVVSSTATGLRLLLRAVPVTQDADADATALLAAAKEGIKRHGEQVTEVVAVPPFVSQNLEFTHEHLKGAFAKLAEAEALNRKGMLVVELEEAEALAKEIALAAPGTALARPLPVYLLGEFRHDGKGKDATVSVKLRAERGGKPAGKPEERSLKPEEAPAAVRKWSAGVLDALAKDDKPRPPADPKAEAKQLADRAFVLRRLGSWGECLTLFEASLLLDPVQTDLHAEAVKALTPLIRPTFARAYLAKTDPKEHVNELGRLYRRGLAHLDAFADKGGDFMKYRDLSGWDMITAFRAAAGHLNSPGTGTPESLRTLLRELRREEDAVLARITPILQRQYRTVGGRAQPLADPHIVVPPWYEPLAKPDPAANRVKMTPIDLTIPPPKPGGPWPEKRLLGLVAAGPKTDVVWSNRTIYLMAEKGKLREAWGTPDRNTGFTAVRFDGKYAWCVGKRWKGPPLLLVLDPATGATHEVTAADGLPLPTAEQVADVTVTYPLTLTTLGPGRVCVAGWLQRSWVAVVTCEPDKKRATVDVIHEAREASDREDRGQWARATVAFRPSFMLTLRDKPDAGGKVATRVLLGRADTENLDVNDIPLVIDPDAPAVAVAPFRLTSGTWVNEESWAGNLLGTDGAAAYRAERSIFPRLLRIPFPGTAREVAAEGLPQGVSFLALQEGRAHVVQTLIGNYDPKNTGPFRGHYGVPVSVQWYVVDRGEKRPKLVGVDLPLIEHVAVSSHYGLVAIVASEKAGESWTLQTVEFTDPKK